MGRVCVIAFVSADDKIFISDFETGEQMHEISGRLVFAGVVSLYNSPVVVVLVNDVDMAIVDAETGKFIRYIRGGFEKAFRAVVSHGPRPVLVFNTWNAQNRRSSIQAYDLFVENPTEAEKMIYPQTGSIYSTSSSSSSSSSSSGCYWAKFFGPPRDDPIIPSNMKTVFEGDSRDGITSLVISQSHYPVICSGHYDNVIRVWDLATLNLLLTLEGHYDWVVSVTIWKGIEPIVVSGSSDGTIKVWDLQTGELVVTCEGHLRDVWAVTVTTGPKPLIVSASSDRTVRTWDVNRVLMDRKWLKRKNFCMFLCCYGLLERPSLIIRPPVEVEVATDMVSAAVAGSFSPSRDEALEQLLRLDEDYVFKPSVTAAAAAAAGGVDLVGVNESENSSVLGDESSSDGCELSEAAQLYPFDTIDNIDSEIELCKLSCSPDITVQNLPNTVEDEEGVPPDGDSDNQGESQCLQLLCEEMEAPATDPEVHAIIRENAMESEKVFRGQLAAKAVFGLQQLCREIASFL